MGSASQKLTWVISKEKQQSMDPSLMEVDWGGKSSPTTHQVDACSCKLTGRKLRVNHINKCMPSEVDWGAHEPYRKDTASLELIGEIMIQVFILWMDAYPLKLIGEPMIQVFSFTLSTLIMMQSQRISSPKNCVDDCHKGHLLPLAWIT